MGKIITVNFRGDEHYGFENDYGVFVALKPIVEAMGLDWSAQYRRVKRDPILAEGIAIMATPFGRGGSQEAVCLKLELVNGWLFTIDAARIKYERVRERVILYQRECYDVLFKHFYGKYEPLSIEEEDANESENARLRMVTEARQTFGPRASGQLWFRLGLPVVPAMLEQPAPDLFDYDKIKTLDPPAAESA